MNGTFQSRIPAKSSSTTPPETHHDDMILGHFDLSVFLLQLHLRRPVGGRFVPVVMFVRHLAEYHEVHLVVAVRVDLNGAVVAAGDVRPDAFAEVADFWGLEISGEVMCGGTRWGLRGRRKEGEGTYAGCPWLSSRSWRTRRLG